MSAAQPEEATAPAYPPEIEAALDAQGKLAASFYEQILDNWPTFCAAQKIDERVPAQDFVAAVLSHVMIATLASSVVVKEAPNAGFARALVADGARMLVDALKVSGVEWALDYLGQRAEGRGTVQ
ncbi:hypothetical protein OSH08_05660 [Kaistia geumhonensis]|uniref:Uncharacterized protein n=1 Tax=Kaistia geumhonensis TaxID=410839 RepID=A0ABU0M5T9_9HYPH|nr:hypothetical protein [Kaistia geumhonensis]MCX5478480.1 hypothetical protein [Kaistia geumhonensis]MDQ0516302.1 hypothetical protein [Kaistia geumhonensis]